MGRPARATLQHALGPADVRPLLTPAPERLRMLVGGGRPWGPGGAPLLFWVADPAGPAGAAAFAGRVAGLGGRSFLAWHGSPLGCWHSILRRGLRVFSGRRGLMVHGNR